MMFPPSEATAGLTYSSKIFTISSSVSFREYSGFEVIDFGSFEKKEGPKIVFSSSR